MLFSTRQVTTIALNTQPAQVQRSRRLHTAHQVTGTPELIGIVNKPVFFFFGKSNRPLLSPGQTDSQVDANRRKFAKPELAYGLAKGGDSQVGSQVAKSRKFHAYYWLMRF